MQFQIISLLVAAGAAIAQNALSVNTPTGSVIQCVPLQLTWTGGQAPFTIVVNSYTGPGQTSLITSIPNVQSSPYTFVPSQAVGVRLQFDIRDATGAQGQSGGTPAVAAGSTTSCVTGGSSSSGAASGSTSAAGTTSSAAASTGGSTSRPASTTSSSAASSATSSRPNSAGSVRAAAGAVAGAVGLAAAALL